MSHSYRTYSPTPGSNKNATQEGKPYAHLSASYKLSAGDPFGIQGQDRVPLESVIPPAAFGAESDILSRPIIPKPASETLPSLVNPNVASVKPTSDPLMIPTDPQAHILIPETGAVAPDEYAQGVEKKPFRDPADQRDFKGRTEGAEGTFAHVRDVAVSAAEAGTQSAKEGFAQGERFVEEALLDIKRAMVSAEGFFEQASSLIGEEAQLLRKRGQEAARVVEDKSAALLESLDKSEASARARDFVEKIKEARGPAGNAWHNSYDSYRTRSEEVVKDLIDRGSQMSVSARHMWAVLIDKTIEYGTAASVLVKDAEGKIWEGVQIAMEEAQQIGTIVASYALLAMRASSRGIEAGEAVAGDIASRTAETANQAIESVSDVLSSPANPNDRSIVTDDAYAPVEELDLEEGVEVPLADIIDATEAERKRRLSSVQTEQGVRHGRVEASAFAHGMRKHLGESGNIPALGVPRRELVRECEDIERSERIAVAEDAQRGAHELASAYLTGLESPIEGNRSGRRASDVALRQRSITAEEFARDEQQTDASRLEGAHKLAALYTEGMEEDAGLESRPVLHQASHHRTLEAEEQARTEKISGQTLQQITSAAAVASTVERGIAGQSQNSATRKAQGILMSESVENERDERIRDAGKLESHAHEEAKLIKEGMADGVSLKEVNSAKADDSLLHAVTKDPDLSYPLIPSNDGLTRPIQLDPSAADSTTATRAATTSATPLDSGLVTPAATPVTRSVSDQYETFGNSSIPADIPSTQVLPATPMDDSAARFRKEPTTMALDTDDESAGLHTIRPHDEENLSDSLYTGSSSHARKDRRNSSSSARSAGSYDPDHPKKIHGMVGKFVGKVEEGFGKVVRKQSMVETGKEKQVQGAAEVEAAKALAKPK